MGLAGDSGRQGGGRRRGSGGGVGGLAVRQAGWDRIPRSHGCSLRTSDPELFGLISTHIFNSKRFPGRPVATICDVTLGACESAGLNTGTFSGVGGGGWRWGGHLPSHMAFKRRGFSLVGGREGSGAGSRSPLIPATQGGQDLGTSDLCLLSAAPCLWLIASAGAGPFAS